MSRNRKLEPKAREMIKQKLYEAGEIETEEAMDIIRPHFLYNAVEAKEREIRRTAHQMMSSLRDEKGIRTTFACKIDGVSKYVDIDICEDSVALRSVEGQLTEKLNGLKLSSEKASKRRMEVEGQISFDLKVIGEKE